MEPVSVILAALAAGASAAAKDTISEATKDAYAGLKALVKKRLSDESKVEMVLAEYEGDPDTWEKSLKKSLVEAGVDKDEEVLQQAQQLLKLVRPQQVAQGKYNIQIGEGKGIAIGDNAQVDQHFGDE